MFEKGLLAGKRILITGGGSGLGAAMARRFAELGTAHLRSSGAEDLLAWTDAQWESHRAGRSKDRA